MASRTRALSGKDANFLIGKYDYSDIFSMVGLSTTRDKADVTVLADKGKAYVPGHFDGTLRLGGIFSALEDQDLQSYVDEASEPIIGTLILGSKAKDRAKMMNVVTSEYSIDTPVDDKAGISGAGQASGLMHHCVALTDVGHSIVSPSTQFIKDKGATALEYIDLGLNHGWSRVRLHVHVTSIGAGLTALRVRVRSGVAVAANSISNADNRNGGQGFNAFASQQYAFELKAGEGDTLDRYWSVEITTVGGTAATIYTAAFGRSQE